MTTQKLSGLELARRWMDSLGMRHYGEVDAAIAKAGAGASGYSATHHTCTAPDLFGYCPPRWQDMGFAAYASDALEIQRCVGKDFEQLFDNTGSTATQPVENAAEKFVWNEALREAKKLVNSAALNSTDRRAESDVKADAELGNADGFTASFNVRVKPLPSGVQANRQSIDITCCANRALAIHLWI